MTDERCTPRPRPCRLHDTREDWQIETGPTTIHAGWYVAALAVVIALSTLWGLN